MDLIIFIPPVVEPAHPPIKNIKKITVLESAGQAPKFSVPYPVVVKRDIAENKELRTDSRPIWYMSNVFT